MDHSVTIDVEYDHPEEAERSRRALEPELADLQDERTQTRVTGGEQQVTIEVVARDLVALRAGTNTWLGLLGVERDTTRVLDDRV